jgi:hypothetical protein
MPNDPCKTALRQLCDFGWVVHVQQDTDGLYTALVFMPGIPERYVMKGKTPELVLASVLREIKRKENIVRNPKKRKPRRTI